MFIHRPDPKRRRKKISVNDTCNVDCPLYDFKVSLDHGHRRPSQWSAKEPIGTPNQERQAKNMYSNINDWQTRLVCLRPGRMGEDLVVDLIVVDLVLAAGVVHHTRQTRLAYEALSYCWGEPVFNCSVTMDQHPYPVTENLYAALQYLRRPDESRYLWIDALSINQHDFQERALQVRNLVDIFKKAKNVLVWLGECDDQTRYCLIYFEGLSAGHDEDDFVEKCCEVHARIMFLGLRKLFARPWYHRLWVRQEVWVAREIQVLCGDCEIPWSWLREIAKLTGTFGQLLEPSSQLRRNLSILFNGLQQADPIALALVEYPTARERLQGYSTDILAPLDVVSVVEASVHCQCSDNRDRIYGVLGMTYASPKNNASADKLRIDYKQSTATVFQDAARYVMWADGTCALLTIQGKFGGTIDGLQLPSWCPNWAHGFSSEWYAGRRSFRPAADEDDMDSGFLGRMLYFKACQVGTILSTRSSHLEGYEKFVKLRFDNRPDTVEREEGRQRSGYVGLGPSTLTNMRLTSSAESEHDFVATGDVRESDIIVYTPTCPHLLILRVIRAAKFSFEIGGAKYSFKGCLGDYGWRWNHAHLSLTQFRIF